VGHRDAVTTVYHGDDVAFDLYPTADPKNGPRIRRLTSLQKATFARREQKGTGIGAIVIPGDSDDAEAIDPELGQYVKVERLGPLVGITTSSAGDDIIDTVGAHGLVVGDKLEFTALTGGAGLSLTPTYYAADVPSSTSLRVAATKGGVALGFTTNITAGSLRKLHTLTGIFLMNGQYAALSADGTKPLLLTGPGPLGYLARGAMAPHSYLGDDPQPEGIFPLHNQGALLGTSALGSMWWRALSEMQATQADDPGDQPNSPHPNDNDRLLNPLPAVTFDFGGFTDSAGAAWTPWEGEFSVQVAVEDGLRIAFRFMQAGLELDMDPDTFEMRAYNPGTLGTDRTGAAWGAGVLRFQVPTDDTVGTGNILTTAKRALSAIIRRSLIWAGMEDVWGVARDAGAPVRWEGGYNSDAGSEAALDVVAGVQLQARTDAGDVPRLRIKAGDDEDAGEYTMGPGGHGDIWDRGTIHSGAGTWDWNEHGAMLSAVEWRYRDDDNGEFDTYVEFGSSFRSIDQALAFSGGATGQHGPHIRLCDRAQEHLSGLATASLKVSNNDDALTAKQHAIDNDLDSRWSPTPDGPTAGHYWAADLGTAKQLDAFRLKYSDVGEFLDLDAYASNDAGAWSWLTEGSKISGDPAANDWTLAKRLTALRGDADEDGVHELGTVLLDAPGAYRYWLLHAVDGGSGADNEFDIWDHELWKAPCAGRGPQAAHCDHCHHADDIVVDNSILQIEGVANAQQAFEALALRIADTSTAAILPHSHPDYAEVALALAAGDADSGGWQWIQEPRAVAYGEKVYYAYVRGDNGDLCVRVVDDADPTDVGSEIVLNSAFGEDIHNNPTLLVRDSDHKLLAFYSDHAGAAMFMRVSTTSLDTDPDLGDGFAAEVNLDSQIGGSEYTYASIIQLTGETNDPLYLIVRNGTASTGVWYYSTSTDGGTTWAARTELVSESGDGPYVKAVRNGDDRIDFLVMEDHPFLSDNSVWHFYYQGGAFHTSDGASLTLPASSANMTRIYDGSAGAPAWTWDMAIGHDGQPRAGYSTGAGGTDHIYWYAQCDELGAWVSHEIAHSLDDLITDVPRGMAIDRTDASIVYLIRDSEPFRATTFDGGATWQLDALATGSADPAQAPASIDDPFPDLRVSRRMRALYLTGAYVTEDDYGLGTSAAVVSTASTHPDLATHDTLGLATQAELDAHAATTHGGSGIGPILIADEHSTPLVFGDLLQNDDGDNLLYADL
jgi:hypothetical protein